VEEARQLLQSGVTVDDLLFYGLEYKYLALYLTGKLSYDEMAAQLNIAIHQFAKRQMTWFRGMERRGVPIHWIDATLPVAEQVRQVLMYSGKRKTAHGKRKTEWPHPRKGHPRPRKGRRYYIIRYSKRKLWGGTRLFTFAGSCHYFTHLTWNP
jgi:hypothetical protein